MFAGCSGLTSVVIPKSITSIEDNAFYSCDNLEIVYYFGENFKNITIGSDNKPLYNADIIYLKLGDTNRDKRVKVKDATLTQMYIAELETGDLENNLCADVNGDGNIDVKDVTLIQMYLAGIIESL